MITCRRCGAGGDYIDIDFNNDDFEELFESVDWRLSTARAVIVINNGECSYSLDESYPDEDEDPKSGNIFLGDNVKFIEYSISHTVNDEKGQEQLHLDGDLKLTNHAKLTTGGKECGGVKIWVGDLETSHKVILRNFGRVDTNADVEVYNERGGRIKTSGASARALTAISDSGNAKVVNRGYIRTTGDINKVASGSGFFLRRLYGIYARSGSGEVKVENYGTVTTSGVGARGVSARMRVGWHTFSGWQ